MIATMLAAGCPTAARPCPDRVSDQSHLRLLVLPPAELHSGGADVHAARPRAARPDRRTGLAELYLALLLPDHRSRRGGGGCGDAEGRRAGDRLAVRGGMAVLVAGRPPVRLPARRRRAADELRPRWIARSISSASPSSA